jgi:hypothetical protein
MFVTTRVTNTSQDLEGGCSLACASPFLSPTRTAHVMVDLTIACHRHQFKHVQVCARYEAKRHLYR